MTLMEALGKTIEEYRIGHGIEFEEIIEASGYNFDLWSRLLRGTAELTVREIVVIGKAMRMREPSILLRNALKLQAKHPHKEEYRKQRRRKSGHRNTVVHAALVSGNEPRGNGQTSCTGEEGQISPRDESPAQEAREVEKELYWGT